MNDTKKNLKAGLKKRIIQSWKASLLGILLLIVGLVLVFTEKATLTEFGIFLPTCLMLIYVKDSVFKINS